LKKPSKRTAVVPTQRPYTIAGKTYRPVASEKGFVQEGMASWYGEDFHGRLTANGEVYDMYAETAAHKTLPMNTYIRVTNLRNRQQITVRVNDRGPFLKGRILDLSYAGARKLGMLESGTAPVRVEALGHKVVSRDKKVRFVPIDFSQGNFSIQVGAFKEKANAERLVGRLSTRYANAHWVVFDSPGGRFYRVRVGKYNSLEKAEAARQEFEATGFTDSFIVGE
jgi:rare lipoprotein A